VRGIRSEQPRFASRKTLTQFQIFFDMQGRRANAAAAADISSFYTYIHQNEILDLIAAF
jgi:hypothetical protein